MLQLQEVEFPQEHFITCRNCNEVLFSVKIITEFVREVDVVSDKVTVLSRYFMLEAEVELSSIITEKQPELKMEKPFSYLFVSNLRCQYCRTLIGVKILTVTSDTPAYQILNRQLIDFSKIQVFSGLEYFTDQLLAQFDDWQIAESENEKEKMNESIPRPNQQKVKMKPVKNETQIDALRKSLQGEKDNQKLIKQVISTIDFFNNILQDLETRVTQAENVMVALKYRVEKAVPALRKL